MTGYTKLFASILDSTIWRESSSTRCVWVTMLAMADRDGRVEASVPGLADRAKVSLDECVEALNSLASPDEWSRTKEHEGRRITEIDGGWRLLNHGKYRERMSAEERRSRDAARKREARARTRADASGHVRRISQTEAEAEADPKAEGESDARAREPLPPSSRETQATEGAQPVLRYEFRKDWKPKQAHRERGIELGLSTKQIVQRAEDCRLKTIRQGFTDEDKHFHRELTWAARDAEKERFSAARERFETPGADRARRQG